MDLYYLYINLVFKFDYTGPGIEKTTQRERSEVAYRYISFESSIDLNQI